MREIRKSGSEGGGTLTRPPYPYSASQKADLAEVFMRGAAASGYEKKNKKKNRWFAKDIVEVIERLYGITYHEKYIWRLLRNVGISEADLRSRGFRVAQ